MQAFLKILRWSVGLLFIFSGLIKANDPLGLSYKMQEFFEVWGVAFLEAMLCSQVKLRHVVVLVIVYHLHQKFHSLKIWF